jgi:hypothetical protein
MYCNLPQIFIEWCNSILNNSCSSTESMSAKSHLSHDFQLSLMQYIHLRFDLRGSDKIKISAYNSDTFLLFCNLSLLINVPMYVIRIIHYYSNDLNRYNDTYFTVLFSISLGISIVCKYTIWYLRRDCNQGHRLHVHLPALQVIFMFSVLVFYALRLFTQIYNGTYFEHEHNTHHHGVCS